MMTMISKGGCSEMRLGDVGICLVRDEEIEDGSDFRIMHLMRSVGAIDGFEDADLVVVVIDDEDESGESFVAVSNEKKKGILEDITNDAKFQPYTLNFLYILIDKKRIDLIGEIFKEFDTVYNKLTDTELAVVSSVVKLEN
ncbi:hypothetical protein KI387_034912 [Taxus chinensis]|uniref:Uncharacterized protein n=1 Tax=Taxus chinensis TaxID=29808 RepID=A0AA38BXP3_TAXCH|nr:hypothetical protein KI387_034912 [Taxus chinensis]